MKPAYPIHKRILHILIIAIIIFPTATLYSQKSDWLQGSWEGRTYSPGSKAVQEFDIVLSIYKTEGNKFEGIIKTMLPFDTSVHFDSRISGAFYDKYLILRRDSILYVKNPPGRNLKWETRCNTCSPPEMIFSIENGRFIFRGEIKGCLRPCNGIMEFSRVMSEFDSSATVILNVLANNEQKPEPAIVVNTASPLQSMASSLMYHTVDTIVSIKEKKQRLFPWKVNRSLSRSSFVFISEANTAFHSQTIIRASRTDTIVSASRKNISLPPLKPVSGAKLKAGGPLIFIPEANTSFQSQTIIRASQKDTIASASRSTMPVLPQKTITELKGEARTLPVHFYERRINVIRTLIVHEDSVTLRVYDNGVIDGDIVSVIYNGQVIIDKLSLTARAVVIKVPVNKTEKNSLVFHAENLGEFPPNTARLEILYGNKKEELTVSSDLMVSSSIDLIYHE